MWERNELYHHGILGMRWGKRNGPPYPLGYEAHSSKEKKKTQKEDWIITKLKRLKKKNRSNGSSMKSGNSNKKQASQNSTEKIKNELKNSKDKITKQEIDDFRKTNLEKYKNDSDKSKWEFYKNATDTQLAEQIHSRNNAKAVLIAVGAMAGIGLGIYVAYKFHSKNVLSSMGLASESLGAKTAIDVSFDQMNDFIFEKGGILHRQVGFANFDLSKTDKALFAAIDANDIKMYKALLGDFDNTGKRFDIALEALNDIKAPSRDKVYKAVETLLQNDEAFKTDMFDTFVKLGHFVDIDKAIRSKDYKDISDNFINAIGAAKGDDVALNKFYNHLKSNGYNAIMDYHDIDAGISKAPIIIFDKTALSKIGEMEVTTQDKLKAIDELIKTPEAAITQKFGEEWLKKAKLAIFTS